MRVQWVTAGLTTSWLLSVRVDHVLLSQGAAFSEARTLPMVESMTREFIKRLERFNENSDFPTMLRGAHTVLGMSSKELAAELQVTPWAVCRWSEGNTLPHFLIQKSLVKGLLRMSREANEDL